MKALHSSRKEWGIIINLLWSEFSYVSLCKNLIILQYLHHIRYLYPRETNVCGVMLESACLSFGLSVCVSIWVCMYRSVYRILEILCQWLLLQLCCYCVESLLIHWWYTEVVQDTFFNYVLPMVQGISSLELRNFCSIASFCRSAGGGGIKSYLLTALVTFTLSWDF